MRRIISLALLLCSIFTTLWAQSHTYKVEEIPMVHLQNRTRYVSNPDGILSAGAVAAMDTTLFALEQRTGVQTLVVAVKQIDGGDCFEFAYQLGEKNGVEKKEKTTDWLSCWLQKNVAFSLPQDMVWKVFFLMLSANRYK